jgi:hypothetical protein
MRRKGHPSFPSAMTLLFFFCAQDIAHAQGAYKRSPRSQCPGLLPLAGFQVTLIGWFWVTPEGCAEVGSVAFAGEYPSAVLPCSRKFTQVFTVFHK